MDGRLEYNLSNAANAGQSYLNLPRDLSANCSKHYGSTKRDGTMLTYVCDVSFISDGDNSVNIYTAKENWVTKNAVKKWHALREFMFRESGLSRKERGKYAQLLRPYFDAAHATGSPANQMDPQQVTIEFDDGTDTWIYGSAVDMAQGDWTFSDIVVETNPDSGGGVLETDTFKLSLTGPHTSAGTGVAEDQAWESVGMIMGYMADRAHPTAEPDDPVDYRNNPLALLKGRSESSLEVVNIAATEAADGPPYDTSVDGDMIKPVLAGFLNTTSAGQQKVTAFGVRIPAGLALFQCAATCELQVVVRRVEESHA